MYIYKIYFALFTLHLHLRKNSDLYHIKSIPHLGEAVGIVASVTTYHTEGWWIDPRRLLYFFFNQKVFYCGLPYKLKQDIRWYSHQTIFSADGLVIRWPDHQMAWSSDGLIIRWPDDLQMAWRSSDDVWQSSDWIVLICFCSFSFFFNSSLAH